MKRKNLLFLLLALLFAPWAANAQEILTVYQNETSTNAYVPVHGINADYYQKCEFVIPASELNDMTGGTISQMAFYTGSTTPASAWSGPFQVFLKEVESTTISAWYGPDGATTVYTGELDATSGTMTVVFNGSTPSYTYNGGNLLVGIYLTSTTGNWKSANFYGKEVNNACGFGENNGSLEGCTFGTQNFIPRTTFTYEPANTDCPNPKTLVASDVTAHGATMTWTMDDETAEYQFNLEYKKTTEETWIRIGLDNTRTYTLTNELDPETEYNVRIQTVCDPENDKWKNGSNFTTLVACPAPTNLAVNPNSITAYEATATWEGTSESYVVSLGVYDYTATPTEFNVQEGFEGSMPTGWTHIGSGSAAPESVSATHTHSGKALKFSGATSNNVVVLPEFEVEANALTIDFWSKAESTSLSYSGYFDLGYVTDATDASTFVKLEEYSCADYGSAYVHIENYSLAAVPAGARIAFRHRSGSTSWYWFIDDVTISGNIYPINWIDYTTSNQSYPFASLTPNTPYQVKVKGNCGDEGYSAEAGPISFTTEVSCFAPTGLALAEGYPTAHGVSFTWDYEEGEVFQYALIQSNVTDPTTVNFNSTWYAGESFPTWDNLTADNDCSFFLRKKCSDTDFSDPVSVNFHTLEACPAPTGFAVVPNSVTGHTADLTWEGTSNSYIVSYRIPGHPEFIDADFEDGTMPNGWTIEGDNQDASKTWRVGTGDNNTSTGAHTGNYNALITHNDRGHETYLVTKTMDLSGKSGLNIHMWYINRPWSSDIDEFGIYYRINGGDWNEIFATTDSHSSWTEINEALPAGAYAANCQIGFKCTDHYGYGVAIDDITLGDMVGGTDWQTATTEETTTTLPGLVAETKYEATLQGDCGSVDGTSTVVGPIYFTTDIACPAPTGFSLETYGSSYASLNWNADADAWQMEITNVTLGGNPGIIDIANNNQLIVNEGVVTFQVNLSAETEYSLRLRANCTSANDGYSEWTAPVTFTTLASCALENVTISNIGHYTATVDWTGESQEGFTVKYRIPASLSLDGISADFEDGAMPEGWTTEGLGTWTVGTGDYSTTTGAHGGTYNAKINHGTSGDVTYLVTPNLDLSAQSGLNINLWYINRKWGSDIDGFGVYYRINGGDWNEIFATTENHESWTEINEALPADAYTTNCQIGFKFADGYGYGVSIDDITMGNPSVIPAGEWQTVTTNENTANLSGLTISTKYDLTVVPNCDETLASEIQQFTTVSENVKYFLGTESEEWLEAGNWEPTGAPTIYQTVELRANATITGEAFAKSIAGTGTGDNAKTLTINDGGKLKHLNSGVTATVKKHINAYTSYQGEGNGGYYLITNPITSGVTPSADNGFLVGNYDLYSWDYSSADEWRNYEASSFTVNSGSYGYLYANETGTDLTYTGTINAYAGNKNRYFSVASNPDNYDFPSWYLLGNPYLYDAYLASASSNGTGLAYYRMNEAGDGIVAATAGTPIEPMEGFFYQAATSASIYVVTYEPTVSSKGQLNMNLRRGNKQLDNAIVVFGGEQQLGKMTFRANSSKVYMPQDGKDFAIVSTESSVGEMPVNFKAENNGTYTLSFNADEVSFAYLHLIDNMTGNETDLLANPSYTFEASSTDYESRFKLVFATGNSSNDDNFAYYSNGSWVINNEGRATLQVIDVNGRILKSESINGCANINVNAAAGIYMIRLVNGDNVKVQKVVVR